MWLLRHSSRRPGCLTAQLGASAAMQLEAALWQLTDTEATHLTEILMIVARGGRMPRRQSSNGGGGGSRRSIKVSK